MQYSDFKKIVFDNVKDFNTVHIFECGQCFRWIKEKADDENDNPVYVGVAGSYAARVSFDDGTLTIEASGGDKAFWADYFDLGTDYGEIKRTLSESEPKIKEATEYGYGIRILNQDLFETLISFIISQNNNIPRIRKCIEAICERFGEKTAEIDGREIYAFPTPEVLAQAEVEDIAALKLGYRSAYIVESSKEYLQYGAPSCRDDLIKMHGIGPKVANCIMLFGLRDVEAFPLDTWVRHIMNDMYGLDEKADKAMYTLAEDRFGEYAGYAQQYLFYYYRDKGL